MEMEPEESVKEAGATARVPVVTEGATMLVEEKVSVPELSEI
jgi:hypothetical protein